MKHIISFFYLNLEIIYLHRQLLFHIRQQLFDINLTACHKKLQVILELMDNRCAMNVIHQGIQDQL